MTNYAIADNFTLLSKLMEIHGENSFRAKSYSIAAFTIEKLEVELSTLSAEKIFSLKNIGEATGKKIIELLKTGQLEVLSTLLEKTPPGVLEMLHIKGLGPKKIAVIWKEMEIESLGELLYACNENRLARYKGFGDKTQEKIKESINFYLSNQGRYLFAQIESYHTNICEYLTKHFAKEVFLQTGEFRRQLEIIDKLEWVTTADANTLITHFSELGFELKQYDTDYSLFKTKENISLCFYHADNSTIYKKQFETSCSSIFLEAWKQEYSLNGTYTSEEDIFNQNNIQFIPAYLREETSVITKAKHHSLPKVLEPAEVKGLIHSHSKWSDGAETIESMAKACIDSGFEYLVMSDHSKTAAYANGLTEERLKAQHEQIDELNKKLAPFKIFKSIESDILNDGSLDYSDAVLSSFDIVIASVHSNLSMQADKAMSRLLKAIENPYTSILGHMTGRLLLSRNGLPLNHEMIIDACAANNVVIELNAHPRRLDMDWRWIYYALEKEVLISINPDAHSSEEFNNIKYGVLAAQKAGLTKEQNLSSFNLAAFENFIQKQQLKRNR